MKTNGRFHIRSVRCIPYFSFDTLTNIMHWEAKIMNHTF